MLICSGQESSEPWPDIRTNYRPDLSISTNAIRPELNVTGPELFFTTKLGAGSIKLAYTLYAAGPLSFAKINS
jgi:hypothetical protein